MSLNQAFPSWIAPTIQGDSLDLAPAGGEPRHEPEKTSRQALLDHFDRQISEGRALLAATPDETLLGGGQPYFTMPRVAVLRSFVMNHHVHHRAQPGVYLPLLDVPVPGLYGPSADELP